jgi:chitinase
MCGKKLGNFVFENNLDGVDIDWEDNTAMESGTGEQWVITFHVHLKKIIPNHIITHAPQAPILQIVTLQEWRICKDK